MRATNKDSKKVCIDPFNNEMLQISRAVSMRNDFAKMGFTSRMAFKQLVGHYYPKYNTKEGDKTLISWWLFRNKETAVNDDIEMVLNKLKTE